MVPFSLFAAWFAANKSSMPKALRDELRKAAVARLQERMQAARADAPLCFADLVAKGEAKIAA